MDFTKTNNTSFYKQEYSGLTFTKAHIKNKEFEACAFKKCIFIECIFDACQFIDCTFSGCSISAPKPYNSRFVNVAFTDSKVMGFDWTKAKSVRFLTFERCDVRYSSFSYLKLPHLVMRECVAHEVDLTEADLTEAHCSKTDFAGARFAQTNLTKADLRGAYNYQIDVNFNTIKQAHFSLPEAISLLSGLDIILDDQLQ